MFDFDATLPFMALQFLLLAALLNAIFYKPITKVLDERDNYIRTNRVDARERKALAERLIKEYEQKIADARKESQAVIAKAEAEAQAVYAQQIAVAQQEGQKLREQTSREIEQQKQEALRSLETKVESLSQQILGKLLGPNLAR
jgi:F-type H+-transporting ATPase subunit b